MVLEVRPPHGSRALLDNLLTVDQLQTQPNVKLLNNAILL